MSVSLTKPVNLTKRPRAGEEGSFENLYHRLFYCDKALVDYVKVTGRHAKPRSVSSVSRATCLCQSNEVSQCPKHDAREYAIFSAKHR